MGLEQIAVIVSILTGLFAVLGAAATWFGGIRVLKHQVAKLEAAHDTGLAIRVTAIEKWIDDFGNAEQVRTWGAIKEAVPELQTEMRDLRSRIVQLEKDQP